MKSPVMPKELPPLPVGKNGKPLVYLGRGGSFQSVGTYWEGYIKNFSTDAWKWGDKWWTPDTTTDFAAESNSEVCKLNGWGDFEEQETPASMLAQWQKAANDARLASEGRFAQLSTALAAEAAHLKECRELENAITVDSTLPLAFKSWYDQGRKDERHHARIRTTFPAMPD